MDVEQASVFKLYLPKMNSHIYDQNSRDKFLMNLPFFLSIYEFINTKGLLCELAFVILISYFSSTNLVREILKYQLHSHVKSMYILF